MMARLRSLVDSLTSSGTARRAFSPLDHSGRAVRGLRRAPVSFTVRLNAASAFVPSLTLTRSGFGAGFFGFGFSPAKRITAFFPRHRFQFGCLRP
jgi:hypothetical protein